MRLSAPFLAVVLALNALPTSHVHADDSRDACLAALTDAELAPLAARVEHDLRRAEKKARGWYFAWLALNLVFVASGVGSAIGYRNQPAWRDTGIWSAAGGSLAVITMSAPPLPTAFATRRFRRLPEHVRSDPRLRLSWQLGLLENGAHKERSIRHWSAHLATGVWALAQGLQLGLQRDSLAASLSNGLGSLAFGEAQLLTSPRAAARALAALERDGVPCVVPRPR